MARFSIPSVRSKLPIDLRQFIDRVREAFDQIGNDTGKIVYESIPGVSVGFFNIASCSAGADYIIGSVLPDDGDRRVRIMVTAGHTGALFTLTHDTDLYTFELTPHESADITVIGQPGIKEPYLLKSDTGSIPFSAQLFIPSKINTA